MLLYLNARFYICKEKCANEEQLINRLSRWTKAPWNIFYFISPRAFLIKPFYVYEAAVFRPLRFENYVVSWVWSEIFCISRHSGAVKVLRPSSGRTQFPSVPLDSHLLRAQTHRCLHLQLLLYVVLPLKHTSPSKNPQISQFYTR